MKKRLFLFYILFFSCVTIWCEDIEPLFQKYKQCRTDQKYIVANELLSLLKTNDYTDTLYQFSSKTSPKKIDFITYSVMADYFNNNSSYDSAYVACKKALENYNKNISNDEYGNCISSMSIALQRQGKFYEAIKVQKKCYELDLKSGNKEYISSSLNNLACLYLATKQYRQAEEFILSSIEIEQALGRNDKLAIRYGTASEIYLKLGDAKKSLEYAQEAYHLDLKEGREGKAAIRLAEMASAQMELGLLDKAKKGLLQAIPILEKEKNLNSLSICYQQLGILYLKQNNNETAAKYYKKALEICSKTGNTYVQKNAHQGLANALKDTDVTEAFMHLQKYSELSDSMYMEESASLLSQFHSIFHTNETNQKNKQLSTENEMHKRSMHYTIIIWILSVLLLLAVLGVLYALLRNKIKANALMKSHEEMRLDFFTKIAHEIRTPLTIIIGQSDSINEGRVSTIEEIKKSAEIIKRNGQNIQSLADQLLEISKLRSGKDQQKWLHGNIVTYTEMIVESFSSWAIQKEVNLNYVPSQENIDIAFIPDYYSKILYNLISNSLKFTDKGGSIMLLTRKYSDQFIISISDTGIGISEKDLPHIFEEFYIGQHDSSTIRVGVGLSLVKQIVDNLNGKIDVKSILGKGTTINVILPLRADKDHLPSLQQESASPSSENSQKTLRTEQIENDNPAKAKVLIVEDNADVMEFIASLLKDKYTILYAKNGNEALQVANEHIPDLIISDLMMPEFDGFRLCEAVRSSTLLSHIPFIIVTAKANEDDRLKGIAVGADVYLTKPFNTNELIVRSSMLIEQRQKLRERFSQAILNNEDTKSEQLSPSDQDFLNRVEEAIVTQMGIGKADVETISSMLCVSSKQLLRKIYAITGETTVSYILHIKLKEAKKMLLEHKEWSISEIATKCGFEGNTYFTKAFKQQYKIPPSQIRKQNFNENQQEKLLNK